MDIYTALNLVMRDVGHVSKDDQNQYQGFKFRGIDAVVQAVSPALREHGVLVMPTNVDTEYTTVAVKNGNATVCRVNATYTFYAPDATSLSTTVAAEAFDSGDKATPKAMSVAFRTALLQALALPTDEADPDEYTYERVQAPQNANMSVSDGNQQWDTGEAVTEKQSKMIHRLATKLELDRASQISGYSHITGRAVESSDDLTKAEASKVIEAMKQRAGENEE